jgi:hypothetical protein
MSRWDIHGKYRPVDVHDVPQELLLHGRRAARVSGGQVPAADGPVGVPDVLGGLLLRVRPGPGGVPAGQVERCELVVVLRLPAVL